CDTLLERGHGRVGNPGIDVAVLLQGEPGCGIRGVVEDEGRGLVDRQCPRARDRIGDVARVDGPGAKAPLPVGAGGAGALWCCAVWICHAFTLPERGARSTLCR